MFSNERLKNEIFLVNSVGHGKNTSDNCEFFTTKKSGIFFQISDTQNFDQTALQNNVGNC